MGEGGPGGAGLVFCGRLCGTVVAVILNPLGDIRHALNRREVQAERPRRPEKVRTIIRRQEVLRLRGERQFARRHVRHDLVVRGASDPFVAGQATTHPLKALRSSRPANLSLISASWRAFR